MGHAVGAAQSATMGSHERYVLRPGTFERALLSRIPRRCTGRASQLRKSRVCRVYSRLPRCPTLLRAQLKGQSDGRVPTVHLGLVAPLGKVGKCMGVEAGIVSRETGHECGLRPSRNSAWSKGMEAYDPAWPRRERCQGHCWTPRSSPEFALAYVSGCVCRIFVPLSFSHQRTRLRLYTSRKSGNVV